MRVCVRLCMFVCSSHGQSLVGRSRGKSCWGGGEGGEPGNLKVRWEEVMSGSSASHVPTRSSEHISVCLCTPPSYICILYRYIYVFSLYYLCILVVEADVCVHGGELLCLVSIHVACFFLSMLLSIYREDIYGS